MAVKYPKTLPSVSAHDVKKITDAYIEKYPNQSATIQKCIEGALILEKICRDSYEDGGHWYYETKSLFCWDEGSREWSWNKNKDGTFKKHCETYESFSWYVLKNDCDMEKATKDMLSDLNVYISYAEDIEGTAW